MTADVYQNLAKHLDNLPGGFPNSETGVEFRILTRLFTPEEAEFAQYLTLIPEEPKVVARRSKMSTEKATKLLEEMALKGLIYRIYSEDEKPTYMALQYVIGIWEFQLNHLDEDFVNDMEEYVPTLFKESWKKPQLRTIPVNKSINSKLNVMTYENAEELIRSIEKSVVAPCICRREFSLLGKGCDKPLETCLVFDEAATYYQRNGLGREISKQEVIDILRNAEKEALVLQPTNSKKIQNICCCCGDCCGVLRNIKNSPNPARMVSTPFFVVNTPDACEGCGICIDRCQMEAIQLKNEKASIDIDRCIGCGLCVTTCSTDSLALVRKPGFDQPSIPQDLIKASIELGRARGKLNLGNLLMMGVKSKFDRLVASL